MLLPLIGFLVFSVTSSIFAIISILLIKKVKLNITNVIAFDFGSAVMLLLFSIIFSLIFNDGNLYSTWSVLLYLITAFISLIVGGLSGIFALTKLRNQFN